MNPKAAYENQRQRSDITRVSCLKTGSCPETCTHNSTWVLPEGHPVWTPLHTSAQRCSLEILMSGHQGIGAAWKFSCPDMFAQHTTFCPTSVWTCAHGFAHATLSHVHVRHELSYLIFLAIFNPNPKYKTIQCHKIQRLVLDPNRPIKNLTNSPFRHLEECLAHEI